MSYRDRYQYGRPGILPGGWVSDVMIREKKEGMQYGMIGYYVPHTIYPDGSHCDPKQPLPYANLASQKNYMSICLSWIYSHEDHRTWFRDAWAKTRKKLDMGKSCVRFKKIQDVPLDLSGQAIKKVSVKQYIDHYESVVKQSGKRAGNHAAEETGEKSAKRAGKK